MAATRKEGKARRRQATERARAGADKFGSGQERQQIEATESGGSMGANKRANGSRKGEMR